MPFDTNLLVNDKIILAIYCPLDFKENYLFWIKVKYKETELIKDVEKLLKDKNIKYSICNRPKGPKCDRKIYLIVCNIEEIKLIKEHLNNKIK